MGRSVSSHLPTNNLKCNNMLVQTLLIPLFISQIQTAPKNSEIALGCIFCAQTRSVFDAISIDAISITDSKSCEGQLNIIPSRKFRYLRTEYKKVPSESKNKWSIMRNKRKDKVKIDYVSIKGNCCWKTCDRNLNCDTYGLGEEKTPKYPSIYTISTSKC